VKSLRRIQAQRTHDLDGRATRGDPPIWKDVTMNFAAKSWTYLVSLKALGATTRDSFMGGAGPFVTTSVKKAQQLPKGRPY